MGHARGIALAISLLFAPCPASGESSSPSRPISLTNTYPLSELHLSHRHEMPFSDWDDRGRLRAMAVVTNSSIDRRSLSVDAESRELLLWYSWPRIGGLEIEAELPYLWRGEGITDDAIDAWHDAFGLPEGSRKRQGDDDYSISGQNRDGSVFSLDDGAGFGNAKLSGKSMLAGGKAGAVAVSITASLPTAESGFGHDSVDGSFSIVGGSRLGRARFSVSAAYLVFGDQRVSGVLYDSRHWEGSAGLEYRALDWLSLQLALLGGENALRVREHDEEALYLDLGAVALLSERSSLELLLRENPWTGQGTADVAGLVGFRLSL